MKPILTMFLLASLGALAAVVVIVVADIGLRQGAGIIAGIWAGIAGTYAVQTLTKSKM